MPGALPLFASESAAQIERLNDERTSLSERIVALPTNAHLRTELTVRLKSLTAKQLSVELSLLREAASND